MIKRILLSFLALVLLLVAAVVNTLRLGSRQLDVPAAPPLPIDEKAVADKLAVNRTVRSLFPGTIDALSLMMGAADFSRHFTAVSDHIYRFSPVRARPEDLPRFHGTNERISASNLAELVRFYNQSIRNAAATAPSP